ncbi:DNA polymerase III subunit beta [Desulfonauticus submarinus]|uniref:Beta sliding clamp n=1 Tax=Desulfonauticus submarinus TaxID=206665 RepID=A0A1H0DVI4_9BACT|nr:DNA polymerase III subunit beta [Desulfonauticus submarinus]SDN74267.1 DNA polymerase-3 subunit beta [Desulfonauticus submarinus]
MNISFKREEVLNGVQKISSILPQKSGAAFLRTIWIKAQDSKIQFLATDSNIEIICNYEGQIKEPGLIGIQGKIFADLLKKLSSGDVNIQLKDQKVIIKQNNNKYTIPSVEKSWFQELNNFPEENKKIWSGDVIKEAIDRVYFCIADDESMESMTCLSLKKGNKDGEIEFCGLNGPKMALYKIYNDDIYDIIPDDGILINKKIVNELKKILTEEDIEINLNNNRLFIRTIDKKEMYSFPLSSYEFPKYHDFLNKYKDQLNSILTLNKQSLIESLDRLFLFNTNTKSTVFKLSEKEIILSAYGSEIGEAEEVLECEYHGNLNQIVLMTKDVIEMLEHFNSSLIKFGFSGTLEPFKIEGEDDPNYVIYAMPVEIEEESYYTEE